MTRAQAAVWSEKITGLEYKITELKHEAAGEFDRIVGHHPLVHALAAMESLAWATRDAVQRFPTVEAIQQPDLL